VRAGRAASAPIDGLLDRVAADQRVDRAALVGPGRSASVVRTRFAAVWLARTALSASWRAIGRQLGRRDHSTIIHAFARAEALRGTDSGFRATTDRLLVALTTGAGERG
jgi:chromosomal replication initiator protein